METVWLLLLLVLFFLGCPYLYDLYLLLFQGIHARTPSGNRLKKDLRVQGHDIK